MDSKAFAEAVRDHPFVAGLKPAFLEKFASLALEVQFGRDEKIFQEGETSGRFYLLLSGKVALEASAPGCILRIQTLGAGDELGWSSVVSAEGKHFQARSLEPVRALAFDGQRLRQLCEQEPAFGYAVMQRLLRVVAERLQATRMQLIDMYAPRGSKLV
ncbi:MAG: Crp/Fnr family transcriptional regulator [bacterium]|jgi:CRP/FNR family cyclic AMP-dependent transcriptional regulator